MMVTKEKIKKEIDRLSAMELEKIYLYLSSLRKKETKSRSIRSLSLKGKLDKENIRSLAHE